MDINIMKKRRVVNTALVKRIFCLFLVFSLLTGVIPGLGGGFLNTAYAATTVSNQSGFGFSSNVSVNPLNDPITMTEYNSWPAGFTKGTNAFFGSVFDGQNIWLIPSSADSLIKLNPTNGNMTSYSSWPAGFTKGANAFSGGIYDGQNIWLIPYTSDSVIKVNKNDGSMTRYNNWPVGINFGTFPFMGATFDGQNIWITPFDANAVVKFNTSDGTMTSYNSWPAGFTKVTMAFAGAIYDGQDVWMIPYGADSVIKINPNNGSMTRYNAWPVGFTKGLNAFAGGVYDGQNIWLVPRGADSVIKVSKVDGSMTRYNTWPAGFAKGSSAFSAGVFDGQNIWLIPSNATHVIKVDATNGNMTAYNAWPSGFTKGTAAFGSGLWDGSNKIWMIPQNASSLITLSATVTNIVPTFVGATTTLTVNQNAAATDIKGLLHASDSDSGQTLTWSQSAAPSHGTLDFSGATASSGGVDITPGGTITYTPTAGYAGSDSFTVRVSDGTATATRTITVTVNDVTSPTLTAGAVNRTSDTTGTVKFTSNEAGQYYYAVVADGAAAPTIDTSGVGTVCTRSETTITNPTGLTAGAKDIYIKVKDAAGNVSSALKIDIAAYSVSINGTLIFSTGNRTNLGQVIHDGQSYSTDIPGIQLDIFNALSASDAANGIATGGFGYYDATTMSPATFGAIEALDNTTSSWNTHEAPPITVIKSHDGSEFSFQSITVVNVCSVQDKTKFEGFRNGSSTGTVTLDNDTDGKGIVFTAAQLTPTIFQNVDEIRISNPNATYPEQIIAFNFIQIGDPVGSNTAPTFVGATTTLSVNQNAAATDIKGLLHVSDSDSSQTLTWSQNTAPSHGTLSFSSATASSGSTDITPGGTITYTPTAGYAGSDSFTVRVSDGTATATRTITVTVNDATYPSLTAGAVSRTSDTTATIKFTSDEAGSYYYKVVSDGVTPTPFVSGPGTACTTSETTITNPIGLTAGAMDIYIKVKDAAGNVSNALKIDIPAYVPPVQDSSISPTSATFDKRISLQGDLTVTIDFKGNTLTSIKNGTAVLTSGTDYILTENTVVISKSYLAAQSNGIVNLTFYFSTGSSQMLTVTVADTTPIPLTVTGITASDKPYDGTTSAALSFSGVAITGVREGDNVQLVTSGAIGAFSNSDVGANKDVLVTGLTLTGANASKYELSAYSTKATIIPKPITVTANAKSKIYGEADPTLTYQVNTGGLVGSDTLTGTLTRASGETVGDYAIGQGTLANGNYAINFVPANLTINKKSITITAEAKSKAYGDNDPALTYKITSGTLVGGDTFIGDLSRATGEAVGTYTIGQGTLAANGNYTITFVPANLTIAKKAITITADAKTKVYGDTDPMLTYKITSGALVGSDVLSGSLTRASGETVGTYAMQQGTLTDSNYAITFIPANLTITKKSITITADAKSKTYGDTEPALTYQVNAGGLVGSDTLTGALTRATGEAVGTYAISQGTVNNSNYTITFVPANLTITKKAITVTADAKSKSYGDADPTLTYKATGLVGSDTLTGSLTRAPGETVGTYAISQGTANNSNYIINFVPADLTITKKSITVTADAKSKVYGSADPTLTYQATGLVGSDTLTGTLTRASGETVGTYAIGQGTLVSNSNYNLTFIPASFTIAKKSVTVTADTKTKVYGDTDPTLTYQVTGLVETDTLTGVLTRDSGNDVGTYNITQGTLGNPNYAISYQSAKLTITKKVLTVIANNKSKTYGDNNPLLTFSYAGFAYGDTEAALDTKPVASTQASVATGVGEYAITVSGGTAKNYTLNYQNGKLTVQKRPVTVKADDKQKMSGDADPTLTYTITNGNLTNGDSFTGTLSRVVGENLTSSALTYDINQNTLTLSDNYELTFVKGIFTIVPSTKCAISAVNLPADTVFTGSSITKTIPYAIEQTPVELTISDFATWKLYSDANCTKEITDKIFRLGVGDNTAYIKVTAQDETTNTVYTLSIHRKSNNTNLSVLSLSSGELSPVFNKDTIAYTSIIKGNVDSITTTATVEDTGKATVTINGTAVASSEASQAIAMALGSGNPLTVVVTAEDTEYTKTYTVMITKLSDNNKLSSLITTGGTFSPAFDKNTQNYTMTVDSAVSQINVKPVVEDTGKATVKINGFELSNVLKSLPINLNPGANTVSIVVIAEDGTPKTYTLNVTRALPANVKSSNTNLIDLTTSEGTLNPSFDKSTVNYTIAIPNTAQSITLKPTAEDSAKASITVDGVAVQSTTASPEIALTAGAVKAVQVKVTAENGTVKTYTVNITRALPNASGDNSLISLTADTEAFNTAFHKDITVYSKNVGFNVLSMNLTPTVSNANATVTVNGKSVQSGVAASVPLRVGSNTITVSVIAQNGAAKTYTVIVTRYSDRLIDLGINSGNLSPQFDRNETLYTAEVENAVSSIKLTPSLERPLSTVKVSDIAVQNMTASQDIALAEGENEISVVVTAEDGAAKEYKIVVVRKAAAPTADQNVELFKKLVDGFNPAVTDSDLISIKSTVENTVKLYESFTNSQKTLAEAGNTGATSRKVRLYALYAKLMSALRYINTQATSTYYVEATTGFITGLDTQLQADDGQQLTIRLNVSPVSSHASSLDGKTVGSVYDLNITEQVTRLADGSVLATNENVEPKAGQKITVKIKVPSGISTKKGLDIVYINSIGNAVTQNARIVTENSNTYLVFEAEHFSKYAIVYTPDPAPQSSGRGSSGIVITANYHESYIKGYPDGTFQPEGSITRAETAEILSRLSKDYDPNLYYASTFSDLESNGWYLKAVGYGSQNGLLAGYEDGTFRPDGKITRAEFAAIIARFLKLNPQATVTSLSDISGHWAEGYIATLFAKGLISGYEDGTFRPDAPITRAEAVKIINAALGRTPSKAKVDLNIESYQIPFTDVDKSHWAYYDILEAAIRHKAADFN